MFLRSLSRSKGDKTMMKIIRSKERHFADHGWLQTNWHFSFAEYHDPANMHWGALRVFNDDVVQPGEGFPMHGHRDMEIITCVLEGALEHRDSLGTHVLVRPGQLNLMTAGHGISHSEDSTARTTLLHGVQLWTALPAVHRDTAPAFQHYAPPALRLEGVTVRVFLGALAWSIASRAAASSTTRPKVFSKNGVRIPE